MRMNMNAARAVAAAWGIALCAGPAHAQFADRNAQQAVTLFRMSCMRFAGNPDRLRAWIATHNLVPITGAASDELAPVKPAKSFWASTSDGKLAISSADSGACAVLAEHGRGLAFETELVGALQRDKVIVTPVAAQKRPDGSAEQQILHAAYGPLLWTLSITTRSYAQAPQALPLVILLATRRKTDS